MLKQPQIFLLSIAFNSSPLGQTCEAKYLKLNVHTIPEIVTLLILTI